MLEFACPKCSEAVKAAEDQAGERIICPKCNETIRVPGEQPKLAQARDDEWSVFDDDEKFIEESMAKRPDVKYRTADDEREPLVDNDEEAAQKEKEEEKAAVAETMARAKMHDLAEGGGASSDMTLEEKMKQDAKFKSDLESLPEDSPLRQKKAWDREQGESADPIRLENQPVTANSIAARCSVCDSVTLVSEEKAGTLIVCADCGSDVTVPNKSEAEAKEKSKQPEWQKWAQLEKQDSDKKQKSKIADELFVDPPQNDDSEYGLAPAPENLLQPVVPIYDEPTDPGKSDEPGGQDLQRDPESENRPPRETSPLETSELFEELQAEKAVKFKRLPWTKHIFGVLTDPGFLFRAFISTAFMVIGYSIFYGSLGLAEMEGDKLAFILSLLGKFIQFCSFPFVPLGFLLICWIGQMVLNSTIVGEKRLPEIESSTVIEFLSNCLFVAVGFALGAIPGFLIGILIWIQINSQTEDVQGFWVIPTLATLFAMLISPLIILSSMHNRSPFKIVSTKMINSIKQKSDAWIEFYLSGSITALVTASLWLIAMSENWLLAFIMLIGINIGFGLYFRMMGRLMGTIVMKTKVKEEKVTESSQPTNTRAETAEEA